MNLGKYMKSLCVAILLIIATHNSFGQSYSITPNDSIVGSVPFNDLFHFIIQQNNLTTDKIILSWEKIYAEIPEGWAAYLCDLGFCYGNFPDNGTMDTVPTGEYGLLSVGVNPFEISGIGVVQYTVWDDAHPETIDTLTWIINSENETGIEFSSPNEFIVYPNPAKDRITISTLLKDSNNYKITNCNGIVVDHGTMQSGQSEISTRTLPNGIYFLTIYDERNVLSKSFIIQQ